MTITVVVVDNHDFICRGVEAALGQEPDLDVIGTFAELDSLLAAGVIPDVVVLDMMLGADDTDLSIERIPELTGLSMSVVLHTAREKPATMQRAMSLGASGLVPKAATPRELISAIRTVAAGGVVWNSPLAQALLDDDAFLPHLTPREREVLESLHDGNDTTKAARSMGITIHAIRGHLKNINAKYRGAGREPSNMAHLLTMAVADGQLDRARPAPTTPQ